MSLHENVIAQTPKWISTTPEEVVKEFMRVNNWYIKHTNYSVEFTHSSYENYTTPVTFEKINGYFYKNNNKYHNLLLGTHTIQNDKFKIVVDSLNKFILVANPSAKNINAFEAAKYIENLSNCVALKKTDTGKEHKIRMEYDDEENIAAYEITINIDGSIKNLVLFYNDIEEEEDDIPNHKKTTPTVAKPRINIAFNNYKLNPIFNYDAVFSETKYIIVSNKKITPQSKYKAFHISDQRLL
ncbi:MAG: hypothetical protein H7331_07695 [Bacteroidia bacterium]|nr:hypothetical protein [Bacteroidia bacterium]